MMPFISIVTPALNMGRFLEDAILSVLHQGYPRFEHIIVDGGSSDDTRTILQRYPHLRWVSEPDRGQSDALNKGFRMASGDLVGWLNADEYYMPGAFHRTVAVATETPTADVYYGDAADVNCTGQFRRIKTAHRFDRRTLLYYGCFIGTANTFFRPSIFSEGFFLDDTYRLVMDFEYFVRLAEHGKRFQYVPSLIGVFRWTGENASLQSDNRRRERLRVQYAWSHLPNFALDTLAEIFRVKRVAMKLANGNYQRELRVREHAGQCTRWFASEQDHSDCVSVLRAYHGNSFASTELQAAVHDRA